MGSRFYGSVSGSARSEATRQGTPSSGITSHTRGWDLGVQVHGFADGDTDVFDVSITGGSNRPSGQFAFRVVIDEEGRVAVTQVGDILLDAAIEILEEE